MNNNIHPPKSLKDAMEGSPLVKNVEPDDVSKVIEKAKQSMPEKKEACFFTVAGNDENKKYAEGLINMVNHFHPDIPFHVFDERHWRFEGDDMYRITPGLARGLMNKYKKVIRLDADQFIFGKLDRILNSNHDIGGVLNFNKMDIRKFGIITTYNIPYNVYINCGLVSLGSEQFVNHWWILCNNPQLFRTLQYREQDVLNILFHYGYPVYKIDLFDQPTKDYRAWHGLRAKGYAPKMILRDGEVILPKSEDGDPEEDTVIKAYHYAGGGHEPDKMNYKIHFSEEMIEYIEKLRAGSGFKSDNVIIGYGE